LVAAVVVQANRLLMPVAVAVVLVGLELILLSL
jgi:hypothetical protein